MKFFLITILFILSVLIVPRSILATTFDLIAPTGELVRGQNVKFTVNIDTEGKSFSSASIGMTYETQYLEFVSVSAGDTFTTVYSDVQGSGKMIITGSSTAPFSGSGVFAYVTYKLIATGPGSTQLCALFNPSSPTSTPVPGAPTSPPTPTSLPQSGQGKSTVQGAILASLFFAAASVSFFVLKKT